MQQNFMLTGHGYQQSRQLSHHHFTAAAAAAAAAASLNFQQQFS